MTNTIGSKKTVFNILKVVISNVLKLLAGVMFGFLIPKIVGVTDYGYYKIFTLYTTYVGLLAFGFIDGIYLKYGGHSFEELDKEKFRAYTRFFVLLEAAMAFIALLFSIFFLSGIYSFIFICLAFYLLGFNLCTYYQFISQITQRFSEFSFINVIHSIINIVFLVAMILIDKNADNLVTCHSFIIYSVFINFAITIVYVIIYREITFGKASKTTIGDYLSIMLLGIPLMISNLSSSLILTIDRQFVSMLFDTDIYAIYAFAYSMLTLITTALSSISVVLYPTMKRVNTDSLKNKYVSLLTIVLLITFASTAIYFPLCWFINFFLPTYSSSLVIFKVILPGMSITSCITIVMHNFYKIFGKNMQFFIKSAIVLILSAIANLIAYYLFKSTIAISIASIIISLVWFAIIEEFFVKQFNVKNYKNYFYIVAMGIFFYFITSIIEVWWIGLICYIAVFCIFSYLLFFEQINRFIIANIRK